MARLKHFRKGDRVQGAKQNAFLGFYEKPGTVVDVLRAKDAENERYLVRFDAMDNPRHVYWFNRDALKELEKDE